MAEGVRIDDLPITTIPSSDHEFPAMKDGLSVKLTIEQVYQVMLALGLVKTEDLGEAATRNIGTTAGTVAAGNDSRITGALPKSGGTMTGSLKLANDASDDMEAVTKKQLDDVSGAAQTWQDVKASRAPNTSYQNTTSATIHVTVYANAVAGSGVALQTSSDGSTWNNTGGSISQAGSNVEACQVAVPPGGYYKLGFLTGSSAPTINSWFELR